MSTADVLGSSPARVAHFESYDAHSSSPSLPSLDEIFRKSPKKPPVRSGSHAVVIPNATGSTFTRAASLLREAPEIDIETEQITYSPPRPANPARKRSAKSQPTIESANHSKAVAPIEIDSSPKDKPWPKFKRKNSSSEPEVEEPQPKTLNGRVTKPAVEGKAAKKKRTETVSKHFGGQEEKKQSEKSKEIEKGTKKGAEKEVAEKAEKELALSRRRDWTPPPADSFETQEPKSDQRELTSSSQKAGPSKEVFQNLFDTYACKENEPHISKHPVKPAEPIAEVLKKRKRLELVSASDETQPKEKCPKKVPHVKKKTTTITGLATAAYVVPEIELLAPGTAQSLLNYFDGDGAVKALVEHQTTVMDINSTKTKKPATKPKKTKKKAGTVENPILLSPNSALKRSSSQEFVFGTSSQLVLEESPNMLRDLQLAMQASNQIENDTFPSSPVGRAVNSRKLWQAGARDMDGDLLEVEVVDFAEKSAISTLQHDAAAEKEPANDASLPKFDGFLDINDIWPPSDEFVDIKDIGFDSLGPSSSTSAPPKSHCFQLQKISLTAAESSSSASSPPSPSEKPASSTPKPKYDLFTDAQLSKQIGSYGFKPVKKRQAMIALLDQCWASKHPASSATVPTAHTAAMLPSAALDSPKKSTRRKRSKSPPGTRFSKKQALAASVPERKKPRGRPKKDAQATSSSAQPATLTTEASPKRPRGRPKKAGTEAVAIARGSSPNARPGAVSGPKASTDEAVPTTPSRQKKSKGKAVEIADSDDEVLSLSPQTSPEQLFSSPPPLDLSITEDGDVSMSLLDPTPVDSSDPASSQLKDLHARITKAVTSAPRSKDPENPSWHEKMLLYDPIVLEELAAWLNAGELTKVGWDGEASPVDVKKWCESKSVICLWRANQRGKERKRY